MQGSGGECRKTPQRIREQAERRPAGRTAHTRLYAEFEASRLEPKPCDHSSKEQTRLAEAAPFVDHVSVEQAEIGGVANRCPIPPPQKAVEQSRERAVQKVLPSTIALDRLHDRGAFPPS